MTLTSLKTLQSQTVSYLNPRSYLCAMITIDGQLDRIESTDKSFGLSVEDYLD